MAKTEGRKLTLKDAEYIREHAKHRGVEATRGHHDMTHAELAEKFGVSARTIGYVITNHILVPEGGERAYLRRDLVRREEAAERRAARAAGFAEPKKGKKEKRATRTPAERKKKASKKAKRGARSARKPRTQESRVERDDAQAPAEAAG